MEGLRSCANDVVQLDLGPAATTTSLTFSSFSSSSSSSSSSCSLSIDVDESAETRIRRLISENPVIIFSRSSCCMCHVMKKLLATLGVHPTVIELEDHEISALPVDSDALRNRAPAVFIGGNCVGGLESLVALHVSGHLVPKLVEVGALWCNVLTMNESVCASENVTWGSMICNSNAKDDGSSQDRPCRQWVPLLKLFTNLRVVSIHKYIYDISSICKPILF